MIVKNEVALASGYSRFQTVLDSACSKLWEKQIQYSIRRIEKLDAELVKLENELDEILFIYGLRHKNKRTQGES
ncbi:MAG: hypothetical protein LBP76_09035 [Treponema sp.]|jgi:hypothetical protein|nr:hypothetical protein [Treponema sp.]